MKISWKSAVTFSVINYLSEAPHPDLLVGLVAYYRHWVQHLQKQGICYTFRIVEDAGDDCTSQSTSGLGRKIRSECLTSKTQSLDLVTEGIYSQTLLTLTATHFACSNDRSYSSLYCLWSSYRLTKLLCVSHGVLKLPSPSRMTYTVLVETLNLTHSLTPLRGQLEDKKSSPWPWPWPLMKIHGLGLGLEDSWLWSKSLTALDLTLTKKIHGLGLDPKKPWPRFGLEGQ